VIGSGTGGTGPQSIAEASDAHEVSIVEIILHGKSLIFCTLADVGLLQSDPEATLVSAQVPPTYFFRSACAAILRTTPSALRRAIKEPDWPMPPASPRPLRWTEGQIERLLWAPQDHKEYEQTTRRTGPRRRR
jgi:hypothetical protein